MPKRVTEREEKGRGRGGERGREGGGEEGRKGVESLKKAFTLDRFNERPQL